jgi:uncharacterized protein YuzE
MNSVSDKDRVVYDGDLDSLHITVDWHKVPNDNILSYEAVDHLIFIQFNQATGGLKDIEILNVKDIIKDIRVGPTMSYDPDKDNLFIYLTDELQTEMSDIVYHDLLNLVLITLARNKVGNLTGIEIQGLKTLVRINGKQAKYN